MSTPAQINQYLKRQGSPLAGLGATFVREGRRNRLDPLLLVAIAGAESDFGKHQPIQPIHNPFGWGPHIKFQSWDEAISTVAHGLRKGYLDEGLKTISQIGAKWAPIGAGNDPTDLNSNWARNVGRFYTELGGSGFTTKTSGAVGGAEPVSTQPLDSLTTLPALPDFSGIAMDALQSTAAGQRPDPASMLSALTMAVAGTQNASPAPIAAPPTPQPQRAAGRPAGDTEDWRQWVGKIEKRTGPSAPHRPEILQFVGKIGRLARTVLTPWGNESHSLTTVDDTPSAHGKGWAADIPASGAELIRLGQTALIAAGAKPEWARKQKGGLFNVGNFQIIFNSQIGGDHSDHVHTGIRGKV